MHKIHVNNNKNVAKRKGKMIKMTKEKNCKEA